MMWSCSESADSALTPRDSAHAAAQLPERTVVFLSGASAAAVGAHMLRHIHAHTALLPISFLPDDADHTANSALMCPINIMGNQEAAKGEDSPIMVLRPDVVSLSNAYAAHTSIACNTTPHHFRCSAVKF